MKIELNIKKIALSILALLFVSICISTPVAATYLYSVGPAWLKLAEGIGLVISSMLIGVFLVLGFIVCIISMLD